MANSLHKFIFVFVPISILGGVLLSFLPYSPTPTFDDTSLLFSVLEKQSFQQVLGENTNKNNSPCGEKKLIIGWINFSGDKTIQQNLPENQNPSACFFTVQEANEAGFFYKSE